MLYHKHHSCKASHLCVFFGVCASDQSGETIYHKHCNCKTSHLCVFFHALVKYLIVKTLYHKHQICTTFHLCVRFFIVKIICHKYHTYKILKAYNSLSGKYKRYGLSFFYVIEKYISYISIRTRLNILLVFSCSSFCICKQWIIWAQTYWTGGITRNLMICAKQEIRGLLINLFLYIIRIRMFIAQIDIRALAWRALHHETFMIK